MSKLSGTRNKVPFDSSCSYFVNSSMFVWLGIVTTRNFRPLWNLVVTLLDSVGIAAVVNNVHVSGNRLCRWW